MSTKRSAVIGLVAAAWILIATTPSLATAPPDAFGDALRDQILRYVKDWTSVDQGALEKIDAESKRFGPRARLLLGLLDVEKGLATDDPDAFDEAAAQFSTVTLAGARGKHGAREASMFRFGAVMKKRPVRHFQFLKRAQVVLERFLEERNDASVRILYANLLHRLSSFYGEQDYLGESAVRSGAADAAFRKARRAIDRSNLARRDKSGLKSELSRQEYESGVPFGALFKLDTRGQRIDEQVSNWLSPSDDDFGCHVEPVRIDARFTLGGGYVRNPMLWGDRPRGDFPADLEDKSDATFGGGFDLTFSREMVDETTVGTWFSGFSKSFDLSAGIGGSFVKYIRNDTLDFDELGVSVGAEWRPWFDGAGGRDYFIGARYEGETTRIDHSSDLDIARFTLPSLTIVWRWRPETRQMRDALDRTVFYHTIEVGKDQEAADDSDLNLDGTSYQYGVRHYYYIGRATDGPPLDKSFSLTPASEMHHLTDDWFWVAAGIRFEDNRIDGAEFDQTAYVADVTTSIPVSYCLTADVSGEWEWGRGREKTVGSISDVALRNRDDFIQRYGAGITYAFYQSASLTVDTRLGAAFTFADSNDDRFEYDRSYVGLSVTFTFGSLSRTKTDVLPTQDLGLGKRNTLDHHTPIVDETLMQ